MKDTNINTAGENKCSTHSQIGYGENKTDSITMDLCKLHAEKRGNTTLKIIDPNFEVLREDDELIQLKINCDEDINDYIHEKAREFYIHEYHQYTPFESEFTVVIPECFNISDVARIESGLRGDYEYTPDDKDYQLMHWMAYVIQSEWSYKGMLRHGIRSNYANQLLPKSRVYSIVIEEKPSRIRQLIHDAMGNCGCSKRMQDLAFKMDHRLFNG